MLLLKFHDRNTCITLAKFCQMEISHMLLAAEIVMHALSQCAGTFTMYNTHTL